MEKVKGLFYFKCLDCGILVKDSSVDINKLNIGDIITLVHNTTNKKSCYSKLKIVQLISEQHDQKVDLDLS